MSQFSHVQACRCLPWAAGCIDTSLQACRCLPWAAACIDTSIQACRCLPWAAGCIDTSIQACRCLPLAACCIDTSIQACRCLPWAAGCIDTSIQEAFLGENGWRDHTLLRLKFIIDVKFASGIKDIIFLFFYPYTDVCLHCILGSFLSHGEKNITGIALGGIRTNDPCKSRVVSYQLDYRDCMIARGSLSFLHIFCLQKWQTEWDK